MKNFLWRFSTPTMDKKLAYVWAKSKKSSSKCLLLGLGLGLALQGTLRKCLTTNIFGVKKVVANSTHGRPMIKKTALKKSHRYLFLRT